MDDEAGRAKMAALEARILKAEQGPGATPPPEPKPVAMSRIGFDFMGAVLGGALAGWLIDHFVPVLAPWAMIAMIVAGFAGGMMNVWRGLSAPPKDK